MNSFPKRNSSILLPFIMSEESPQGDIGDLKDNKF
jgi:hypothetical protein